jgi:hypothetical protein
MSELRSRKKPRPKKPVTGAGTVARIHWPRMVELRAQGTNITELAAAMGRSIAATSRTVHHPEFVAEVQQVIDRRRELMAQDITAYGIEALGIILEIARHAQEEPVRLRAACDLADRAGAAAPKRLELTGAQGGPVQVATLTPESLAAMTPAQLAALTGVQYAPTRGEDDGSSPDEE